MNLPHPNTTDPYTCPCGEPVATRCTTCGEGLCADCTVAVTMVGDVTVVVLSDAAQRHRRGACMEPA